MSPQILKKLRQESIETRVEPCLDSIGSRDAQDITKGVATQSHLRTCHSLSNQTQWKLQRPELAKMKAAGQDKAKPARMRLAQTTRPTKGS